MSTLDWWHRQGTGPRRSKLGGLPVYPREALDSFADDVLNGDDRHENPAA